MVRARWIHSAYRISVAQHKYGHRASVCWFRSTIEPTLFAFKKRLVSEYDVEVNSGL